MRDEEAIVAESIGAVRIVLERRRQMVEEGWTPEHDDEHVNRQLVRAASCYLFQYLSQVGWPPRRQPDAAPSGLPPARFAGWPWRDGWKQSDDPIRNLEKAGALIAAEIDRLIRKTTP